MKVYAAAEHAFTAEAERLLTMFAGPAAALLAHVQTKDLPVKLSESIRHALGSRDTINIGKGLLMAGHGFDEEAATTHLIQMAREEHVTVTETAQRVIATRHRQSGQAL